MLEVVGKESGLGAMRMQRDLRISTFRMWLSPYGVVIPLTLRCRGPYSLTSRTTEKADGDNPTDASDNPCLSRAAG